MKHDQNASLRRRKKGILMSFLAAAAVLYLTACAEVPEPMETRATTFSDTSTVAPSESQSDGVQTTAPQTTEDPNGEPADTAQTTTDSVHPVPPPDDADEETGIHTETTETLESIPYDTVYEYSDQYYEDERFVRVSGIDGCRLVTLVTTYQGGKVTDVSEHTEVLYQPTNEVIVIGTKKVITYGTAIVTENEVPFETEYVYDENAYDDERTTVQAGQNGYTTSEYRITYEKGVEVARELVTSEVTPPVPEILRIGTKPAYTEERVTREENFVSYETVYEYDSTLEEGVQQVIVEGKDGYTENTYRITYYHGEEISRELVERTVHEPQNEVIVIGTKKEETFGMPYVDAAHGGYDYNVTQDFGGSNNHGGIDFGVWYGEPIVSVMSGTVVYAYDEGDIPTSDLRWTYGTYVVVEHENGMRTYYAHLSSRTVSVGDTVEKGEIVGYSGNTGRVSPAPTPSNPLAGTHLHFEIRVWNGSTYVKADPKDYLPRWNY